MQHLLPWNPQGFGAVAPDLAFNTAASFTTNTNWQAYAGETTMSYLTQMAGLAYHNFISAATGIALAIAFIRGIAQREKRHHRQLLGRHGARPACGCCSRFCMVGALFLVSQGVVQNLRPYDVVTTVEGAKQTIAQGPVASQEIIKEFGTNGGGFFNANSAHPFENPTPLTNFVEMFLIFAISAGLTFTLGDMTGSRRHGWAVWAAMAFLFLAGVTTAYWAESRGNPLLTTAGADQTVSDLSPGGNMEGKDTRFGIANSALFATVTTDASCGAINGWHDSFTPLGGLVPLVNIMLGEVIFGGVGAGMYGILVFIVLSVFIAGLMVGRTPEYLGKKIDAYDVQMAMLVVLVFPLTILVFTGISMVAPSFGTASIFNPGPHGLSEILYAYTSGDREQRLGLRRPEREHPLVQRHASAFAMLIGRFFMIIPMLAIAGHLGRAEAHSAVTRHVPGDHAALRGAAGQRDPDRRRAHVLPRAQPRARSSSTC